MPDKLASVVNEPLDRAPEVLPAASFNMAMELHKKHAWLLQRSNAFLELWNCCKSIAEQELIYSLVDRFIYFSNEDLLSASESIAKWVLESKKEGRRALLIAVSDDSNSDGSLLVLQYLKNKFSGEKGWSEDSFFNNYSEGLKAIQEGDFVVLLDDFIGTGRTIVRKYQAMEKSIAEKKFQKVSLRATAFSGMKFAQDKLRTEKIDHFCPNWFDKGISEHFIGEELEIAVAAMTSLESRLKKKYKGRRLSDVKFGFGESEALFCAMDLNIPNNVFPIFWWPEFENKTPRTTMFRRLI